MYLVACFAAWTAIAWLVFRWTTLPAAVREWGQRLLLIAAVASFAVAPFLSGSLSQAVGPFIAGPNLHPAETVERSMRASALGVGFTWLALYALARWGKDLPWRHPVANAATLTLLLMVLRVDSRSWACP